MISAKNICKSYKKGAVKVLKGVSLAISDGEFLVITGASGSGKSTLMNVLSGLERVDEGTVLCEGRELSAMCDRELTKFRRDNVGFVFQQYYLLPHLSVENNVRLGADLSGNGEFREIISAVGLGDKLKSRPSELSGGEQQRVCIARALAKKPKILFLDEPTGALDEKTGREVLDYILNLHKENGFTMIMVTHNLNIAETAQAVVKMNSGVIASSYRNSVRKSAYEIDW